MVHKLGMCKNRIMNDVHYSTEACVYTCLVFRLDQFVPVRSCHRRVEPRINRSLYLLNVGISLGL